MKRYTWEPEASPRERIRWALEHNEFEFARREMQDNGLEEEKELFLENLDPEARKEFRIYDERETKKERRS